MQRKRSGETLGEAREKAGGLDATQTALQMLGMLSVLRVCLVLSALVC